MNVNDAIFRAVHDYLGGTEALAARMRLAAQSLRNMANPNDPTHGWSLVRFMELLAFTGDTRPLEALCVQFGGVFVPMPKADQSADQVLMDLANLAKEFGDVPRETLAAMADGRVTLKEFERVRQQVTELQATAAALLGHLEQRVERAPAVRVVK